MNINPVAAIELLTLKYGNDFKSKIDKFLKEFIVTLDPATQQSLTRQLEIYTDAAHNVDAITGRGDKIANSIKESAHMNDPVTSFMCYEIRALLGGVNAQYYLGYHYETGKEIKKDDKEAFK